MANDLETILIVDDEEPVRRTFTDWLSTSGIPCHIFAAADAEKALQLANEHAVDLAILDWALGAGDDGLQLLQDLYAFHPNVVAIMVTGYANQATPLDAMRMGVRDYLDKNSDLNKDNFLAAVRRQLDIIRPARQARRLHDSLVSFRDAVAKILPLVESASALNDPVTVPEAVGGLLRFLMQATRASVGVLLVRHYDPQAEPAETTRVFGANGRNMEGSLVPFTRSIAGTALSMQQPCVMANLDQAKIDLQFFEQGRRNLLAVPLNVAPGLQAVIELLDKQSGMFDPDDQRLASAAAELGSALLQQALGQKQSQKLLVAAVEAALQASEKMAESLGKGPRPDEPPPPQVMDQLREGLSSAAQDNTSGEQSLRLAEAIRILAQRHGPVALGHCLTLVEKTGKLLDDVTSGCG